MRPVAVIAATAYKPHPAFDAAVGFQGARVLCSGAHLCGGRAGGTAAWPWTLSPQHATPQDGDCSSDGHRWRAVLGSSRTAVEAGSEGLRRSVWVSASSGGRCPTLTAKYRAMMHCGTTRSALGRRQLVS